MDSELVLGWLLLDADESSSDENWRYRVPDLESLNEHLTILNRKETNLPPTIPTSIDEMLRVLRKHFNDNVTLISLVLNYFFPHKFVYYRVSKLDNEIFEGLNFFSDVVPQFKFSFSGGVGKRGFERYLALNEALMNFAELYWPDVTDVSELQGNLLWFLYHGIGRLFWNKSSYSRYWIMTTDKENWAELDSEQEVRWSGRKEMQKGDLVFMYRTSPRMAITELYRVKDYPEFDPWGGWDGFWVDMEKICPVKDITFAEMRTDNILGQWGVVRSQFQGATCEPVPAIVYNRLLEKIPLSIRQEYELELEEVKLVEGSGTYTSEAEFEDEIIEPLLKQLGFQYTPQHPCLFYYGSQRHLCWVDFLVKDNGRSLTLFEDKLRILNDKELTLAVEQAKSYALMLGLPSFVVAAPEGVWVYSLNRNKEKLERKFLPNEVSSRPDEFKSLLIRLGTI